MLEVPLHFDVLSFHLISISKLLLISALRSSFEVRCLMPFNVRCSRSFKIQFSKLRLHLNLKVASQIRLWTCVYNSNLRLRLKYEFTFPFDFRFKRYAWLMVLSVSCKWRFESSFQFQVVKSWLNWILKFIIPSY